ncbi:MAG TPA: GNAT family N-acetyltransferase [Gemmatimonadaceae bacterium]|nr:GNAT family N-acetyltransferase [Gemmatimonadaceae bacterium]
MSEPLIRRAVAADADALAAFAERTFVNTYGAYNTASDMAAYVAGAFGAALQGRELADPGPVTLAVDAGGALAGYAQLRRPGPAPACVAGAAPAEICRFYVDAPWQGRGLAARLMDAVREAAAALGAGTLWLGVWERNARARTFYAKCGFREVGAAEFVLGTDRQADRVLSRSVA